MSLLLLFSSTTPTDGINVNYRRAVGAGTKSTPGLYAMHFDRDDGTAIERLPNITNIGVRWALPGGVQRIEVTMKATSREETYFRYVNHHGNRISIMDYFGFRPIVDGRVYEVVPDGQNVTYIVDGAWKRHEDEYETDNPATAATSSDTYLKSVLTNHVPAVSTTQTNIAATGTTMGAIFAVNESIGDRPKSIVETITSIGTSTSGEALDYWTVPAVLNDRVPLPPLPYLQGRNSIANVTTTYHIRRRDLKDISLSRHIYKLENSTTIYYPPSTTLAVDTYARDTRTTIADTAYQTITVASASDLATDNEIEIALDSGNAHRCTIINVDGTSITIDRPLPGQATKLTSGAASPDTTLTVSSITGFADGDYLALVLDSGSLHETRITGTPTGSTITITDAVPSAAAVDNAVMILAAGNGNVVKRTDPLKATTATTDTTSQTTYWTRYYAEERTDMNATQAAQYQALRQNAYAYPSQQTRFTIGSRWIRLNGTRVPVWRLLINPGLIVIDDLFADSGTIDETLDGKNVFRIVALDYDYAGNTMTVTPDSLDGDARIDVFMQRLGFSVGQIIERSNSAYGRR